MAQIETWYNQDLKQPVKVHYLHGNVFSQDNQGNILGVNVFDDGSPASLSGTVNAYIIRSDGATVPATGSISGNKASVALPEAAYAIPGIISVVLKLTTGSVVVTLLAIVATVYTSTTNTAVDPGTIIPSIEDLIEAIDEAVASIPPDYSATVNALNAKYGIGWDKVITYNIDTHVISFPGGFYTFAGISRSVNAQTLDVSSVLDTSACNLWINSSGVIAPGAWNGNAMSGYELLGYIFGRNVYINGVPFRNIKVIDSNGNLQVGTIFSPSIAGMSNGTEIVYNYTTKTLSIPAAFSAYKGYGTARSATSIDLTNVLDTEACILYMRENRTIYAVSWVGCTAENQNDVLIGYIFRKQVVIFGVNPSQISVIDESTDKVFCFGDSITAGVGTSKLYHMWWHDFNPNLQFHNWGIGSTGYVLEWTGTAVVGGGAIGDGTSQSVSGDNNVLKVMQGISGSMPNICIFSGTNDYGNNRPLTDFRTAVQNTLDYALTKTSKILVITPIKRNGWETGTNSLGLHLKDYCDVIIEECEERGIIYSDGFDVGLNPSVSNVRTAFMPDGLHPNESGQARIAREINNKMLEAFCR